MLLYKGKIDIILSKNLHQRHYFLLFFHFIDIKRQRKLAVSSDIILPTPVLATLIDATQIKPVLFVLHSQGD
jgi:hypothetical protein